VGDVVRPGVVIDRKTRERFVDSRFDGVLVTVDRVANVAEKKELRIVWDAGVVDMEAATVCRLAKAHGLKFRAVKAVSDEADFEMEVLGKFATKDGQFRERAFALHAAMRPAMWGKVRALARNSDKAMHALAEALRHELDLN
jgi:adenosylhomocysteine nucleosidase